MKKGDSIKPGQVWIDRNSRDIMRISSRNHDIYWNCTFDRGNRTHKISQFVIWHYYYLAKNSFNDIRKVGEDLFLPLLTIDTP